MTGAMDSTEHLYNGVVVEHMKVTELKSTLAEHGLSTKGVKKDLYHRLVEYLDTISTNKDSEKKVEEIEDGGDNTVVDNAKENNDEIICTDGDSTNVDIPEEVKEKLNESFIEDCSKGDSIEAEPTDKDVPLLEEDNTKVVEEEEESTQNNIDSKELVSTQDIETKIVENGFSQTEDVKTDLVEEDNNVPVASSTPIELRITRIESKKEIENNGQQENDKPRAKKRERITFESDFKGLYSQNKNDSLDSPKPSKRSLVEKEILPNLIEKNMCNGIVIENLQRPWNNGTIKKKLDTYGSVIDGSLCSNEKKTICLVLFENEEMATKAMDALNGTKELPCGTQGLSVKKIDGKEYKSLKENLNNDNGMFSKSFGGSKLNITIESLKDKDTKIHSKITSTESHHHHKDKEQHKYDKDNISNHRFAGLFPLETKNVVYINNLTRPFCTLQLKAMLQSHNTMLDEHFYFMDKKSKCVAVYRSENAATAICEVLAENKFPQDELGKILNSTIITFGEYIKKLKYSNIDENPYNEPTTIEAAISDGRNVRKSSSSPRKKSPVIVDRKSNSRREETKSYRHEPDVAPSLPGMKITDVKPSLAYADNTYKMPPDHEGWELYSRNDTRRRFDDRRRRDEPSFNRRRRSTSRDRR
uniref:SAP domain-containing protein n=1 Tax=Parastrongyloides trichosuri TaxID=131310 RepID=A0A0N4Z9Q3_PARTI